MNIKKPTKIVLFFFSTNDLNHDQRYVFMRKGTGEEHAVSHRQLSALANPLHCKGAP